MSFSFMAPNTWSVNWPPGMWRMCSSIAGLAAVRRGRHRVAAARAVLQEELDVLAGVVLEAVVGRQLQLDDHDVVRGAGQAADAHRQLLDRQRVGGGHLARLEHQVAASGGAAGQHEAGGFLLGAERLGLVPAMDDAAGNLLALAGAAGAVLAAVGQA
jgi:hypothetical protein